MQEPTTPEEVFELQRLRRADPQRFLEIVNEWLREDPRNFRAYFKRHFVWSEMGEPRRALDDLDKVIELAPSQPHFFARGMVHRQLGEHENALMDFHRGEAMGKKEWQDHAITLFFQADSYAQVGDVRLIRCMIQCDEHVELVALGEDLIGGDACLRPHRTALNL